MNLASASPSLAPRATTPRPARRIAVGLLAAGLGALHTVSARGGIRHGLQASELKVSRFGVDGLVTLPVLLWVWRADAAQFSQQWRLWSAVARKLVH